MMRLILTATIVLGLSACVPGVISSGHKFDMAKADALVPGVSTLEDAKAQIGEPYSVENNADGTILIKWVYAANGVIGVHMDGIAVLFGADHKMIRVTKRQTA